MADSSQFLLKRVTTPQEKKEVFRLRYSVYVEEMHRKQPQANHGEKLIIEPLDHTAVILGCFDTRTAQLLGALRINYSDTSELPDPQLYDFESFERHFPGRLAFISKLTLVKESRSSLVFLELAKRAYQDGLERGSEVAILDCNEHLVSTFERLGFRSYKGRADHPLYGLVTPMVLYVNDAESLQRIHSPFAKVLRSFRSKSESTSALPPRMAVPSSNRTYNSRSRWRKHDLF